MNINQKINFRGDAIYYMQTNQYFQLVERNAMILAPYYNDRLKQQGRHVADNENFKTTFGKYRWEYDNDI